MSRGAWLASQDSALSESLISVGRIAGDMLLKLAEAGDAPSIVRVAEAIVAMANGNSALVYTIVEDLNRESKVR